MKHTKKLLALLFALLMVFAMAACDDSMVVTPPGPEIDVGDLPDDFPLAGAEAENTPDEIVDAFIVAFESGKVSQLEPLCHDACLEAEGADAEYFSEWEAGLEAEGAVYAIDISSSSAASEEDLADMISEYEEAYGLVIEEAQMYELDVVLEYGEDTESGTESIYVVKIDNCWYLEPIYSGIF